MPSLLKPFHHPASGYRYYLSLPPTYTPEAKYPLLIFLHGAGESARGPGEEQLERIKKHGIPKIVESYSGGIPPFGNINVEESGKKKKSPRNNRGSDDEEVDGSTKPVSPKIAKQISENYITLSPQVDITNGYGWSPAKLTTLLTHITTTYPIDPNRIILTGVSMGGYGTFDFATSNPTKFAAIIPICGGADPRLVRVLAGVPIWVFHGNKDGIIPTSESEKAVAALKKAGGEVRFTVYEGDGEGHDSWTRAYEEEELWEWVGERKRGE